MRVNRGERTHEDRVVLHLFRNVWNEYFAWEPSYCAEQLSLVRAHIRPKEDSLDMLLDSIEDTAELPGDTEDEGIATTLTFYDVSPSGAIDARIMRPQTFSEKTALPDIYPEYESCTPINHNILLGDDSNYLPFMPFADDPTFDYRDYMYDHKGLAWQEVYRDSDGAHMRSR